jgi:hypothetical protein
LKDSDMLFFDFSNSVTLQTVSCSYCDRNVGLWSYTPVSTPVDTGMSDFQEMDLSADSPIAFADSDNQSDRPVLYSHVPQLHGQLSDAGFQGLLTDLDNINSESLSTSAGQLLQVDGAGTFAGGSDGDSDDDIQYIGSDSDDDGAAVPANIIAHHILAAAGNVVDNEDDEESDDNSIDIELINEVVDSDESDDEEEDYEEGEVEAHMIPPDAGLLRQGQFVADRESDDSFSDEEEEEFEEGEVPLAPRQQAAATVEEEEEDYLDEEDNIQGQGGEDYAATVVAGPSSEEDSNSVDEQAGVLRSEECEVEQRQLGDAASDLDFEGQGLMSLPVLPESKGTATVEMESDVGEALHLPGDEDTRVTELQPEETGADSSSNITLANAEEQQEGEGQVDAVPQSDNDNATLGGGNGVAADDGPHVLLSGIDSDVVHASDVQLNDENAVIASEALSQLHREEEAARMETSVSGAAADNNDNNITVSFDDVLADSSVNLNLEAGSAEQSEVNVADSHMQDDVTTTATATGDSDDVHVSADSGVESREVQTMDDLELAARSRSRKRSVSVQCDDEERELQLLTSPSRANADGNTARRSKKPKLQVRRLFWN